MIDNNKTKDQFKFEQSQEFFKNVINSLDDPIFVKDRKHRWVFLNNATCKFWGHPKEELIGKSDYDIFPKEQADVYWEKDDVVFENEKPDLNEEAQTIDGKLHTISTKKSIYQDSHTGEKFIVGTIRDITEHKYAEELLQKSEERFKTIVETAPSLLHITDMKGNNIYISPNCKEITGYSQEELLGKIVWWVHEDDSQKAKKAFDRTYQTGEGGKSFEYKAVKKNGEVWLASTSWEPLEDKEGKITGILLQTIDISEHKKVEEEKEKIQTQLRLSHKLEAVGRLAGGIAHDFNNILTAIIGYSDLILKDNLNKKTHLYVEEIRRSADRAASLTQQLLAFSRKQIMKPKVLNLNELITNINQMLQRLISEDIELVTGLNPELGTVKADAGQIEQVIINLAVNARDAMPTGGKLIIKTQNVYLNEEYCKSHRGSHPGNYIQLEVRDSGHGIDETAMKHIFEPFFTTKEVGKGTGLGLSTVYGIVKQSGGYIWVDSKLNQGTVITIYFPRVDEVVKKQKSVHEEVTIIGGSETILIVEDEDAVRNMASEILKNLGYTIIEARDGIEALQIFETKGEKVINLVIIDVVIPKMSGRDLANRLLIQYPEMKVLYTSGYTDDVMIHHGVLYRGISFLQKPFTSITLARKVREVLDTP